MVLLLGAWVLLVQNPPARIYDHHQHLFSPEIQRFRGEREIFTAADLIRQMDEAGILTSVVLSNAYMFGNPHRPPVENEREKVKQENDWSAQQVAQFPGRLTVFCGVHPLKDYTLDEIDRCAKDRYLRAGLKLHFGNSDVRLEFPEHLEKVKAVFRQANRNGMPVLVHLRANVTHRRPYGEEQGRIFLEQVLPQAPKVPVVIAHLAGAGGYDESQDAAMRVFTAAIAQRDARMKRVCFDVSGVAGLGDWESRATLVAQRIREVGLARVVYGSDSLGAGERSPLARWQAFRRYPLTEKEFAAIEQNRRCR